MKNRQRDIMLLIADVRAGRLSRREAIVRLAGLGLSATGIAATLAAVASRLAAAGGARGTGGVLKLLP